MIGPADFGIAAGDLAGDLPQTWRVTVAGPAEHVFEGTAGDPDAALEHVTITFDASRVPRVDATVVVAVDPEVAADIDPDAGVPIIVTVAAGYATAPLVTLAELHLETADYDAGRLTLRALSAEFKVLESAELVATYVPPQLEAGALIAHLLDAGGSFVLLNNPEALTGQTLALEAVDDVWDAVWTVAAGEGWRLYSPERDTGEGILEIRRTPTGNEPAAVSLRTGPAGTVARVARSRSRARYATEVAVIHEWTTPDGTRDRRVQAVARAPIAGIDNTRRAVYRYRNAATPTQATGAAQAYLHRALARLTAHDVTAVNAFWTRPDMVAELDDPAGQLIEQLVDRVTFTSSGVMTLTTRGIPVWWSIGDAATAYPTIAAHRAAFATLGDAAQGPTT